MENVSMNRKDIKHSMNYVPSVVNNSYLEYVWK